MRVLLACEESQAVCKEFRRLGHEAYSCDILPCSGGHPEWHIEGDVLEQLDNGWDMMIAFPPCTHLAVSGAAWFEEKRKDGRQQEGIDFFMAIVNAPIDRIAIENPIGIMSNEYRKPDQVIQPYYFGDPYQKTTCLWLKDLPPLFHAKEADLFNDKITHVDNDDVWVSADGGSQMSAWYYETSLISTKNGERAKARSKTFQGIAKAMADQWGKIEKL